MYETSARSYVLLLVEFRHPRRGTSYCHHGSSCGIERGKRCSPWQTTKDIPHTTEQPPRASPGNDNITPDLQLVEAASTHKGPKRTTITQMAPAAARWNSNHTWGRETMRQHIETTTPTNTKRTEHSVTPSIFKLLQNIHTLLLSTYSSSGDNTLWGCGAPPKPDQTTYRAATSVVASSRWILHVSACHVIARNEA
jgi:hypothetical protein